ncbi:hypothetical protein FOCC_FOCC013105 [Frankliniella occidentalis]|nr:hypothetical protein FOCC_FOCC013105 [Frankliniella occidentalis]
MLFHEAFSFLSPPLFFVFKTSVGRGCMLISLLMLVVCCLLLQYLLVYVHAFSCCKFNYCLFVACLNFFPKDHHIFACLKPQYFISIFMLCFPVLPLVSSLKPACMLIALLFLYKVKLAGSLAMTNF